MQAAKTENVKQKNLNNGFVNKKATALPLPTVNVVTAKQKWQYYKKQPLSLLLLLLVWLAAILTAVVVLSLVGYVLVRGIPNISSDLFAWEYTSVNCSMTPAIVNTVVMTAFSLLLAVPIGIFSAIYLVEYAKRGNVLVKVIRFTSETLAGIPSIVYGLFGYLIFVIACGFDYSLLSGALTLSIMILPVIIRTSEEALKGVPDSFREGSFGIGAGPLRTVCKVVLPSAVPGIMAGIILAIGRIVGETAALIYTSGTVTGISDSLLASGRTLSVHMYALLSEGLYINQAYATAVILLVMVLAINALSGLVARKMSVK